MLYNLGMAKILRTEERNGEIIAVYESGAEYNQTTKRLVKAPPSAAITSENSNFYKRKRQEKAAAALRSRILESTRKRSTLPLNSSAEAIAEAGAYIWDEVVLGEDVYPRDRLDAWEKLGKYAGVLPADIRQGDTDTATTAATAAAAGAAVATVLERVLRDVLAVGGRRDVVDGTVTAEDGRTGDGEQGGEGE